jgi:hypothetical protein
MNMSLLQLCHVSCRPSPIVRYTERYTASGGMDDTYYFPVPQISCPWSGVIGEDRRDMDGGTAYQLHKKTFRPDLQFRKKESNERMHVGHQITVDMFRGREKE